MVTICDNLNNPLGKFQHVICHVIKHHTGCADSVAGELDRETAETMSLPRCGVRDKVGYASDSRSKRYALQGTRLTQRDEPLSVMYDVGVTVFTSSDQF
jgi:hypothetical protein